MKMNKEQFIQILYKEAKQINIELSKEHLEKLYTYKEMLQEANEKFNLTNIIDDEEIIFKHFIDCLETIKHVTTESKIADVGTGAGFPGIVVSIFFGRRVDITLIESNNKKAKFLEEVITKINLENCYVLNQRVEEILKKDNKYIEWFDFVLSRAVASLNILLEYSIPILKVGGKAIFMKGPALEKELLYSYNALLVLDGRVIKKLTYAIQTPKERLERTIAIIEKVKTTNKEYPRIYSKIKKNPL